MNIIIGFSGKRGSGKTTGANFLKDTFKFKKVSFADKLKEYSEILVPGITKDLGIKNKEKPFFKNGESRRDFMIKFGQFMRYYDQDYWVKASGLEAKVGKVVIDDVRFPNEAEYIKSLGGKIIRVKRYPKLNVYGPEELDDPSETSLDNYDKFDAVIEDCVNITLNDLYKQVTQVMENLGVF